MIVVDVNILAYYLIEGERTPEAQALRLRDADWRVPVFWIFEFQSILSKYVRHGGMPAEDAQNLLAQAMSMFAAQELSMPADVVLQDALTSNISTYDAQYLSLARQLSVPCVTEDATLRKACPSVAVSLAEFLRRTELPPPAREAKAAYRAGRKKKPS